jgi:hypothetical protein
MVRLGGCWGLDQPRGKHPGGQASTLTRPGLLEEYESLIEWLVGCMRGCGAEVEYEMVGLGQRVMARRAKSAATWGTHKIRANLNASGKEMMSPSPPPLRTVHTDHPVHGSSNLRTPRGALLL